MLNSACLKTGMSVVVMYPRLLAWFSCADGVISGEAHILQICDILWLSRIGEYVSRKAQGHEKIQQ